MTDSFITVPTMFIGSSLEGLEVARSIEVNLEKDAEITLWSNGVFGLNEGFLESLVNALEKFDFAVLVLTPDDLVTSRRKSAQAPRDNVMFELGLFMGRLGRNRTFIVCSDSENMKLPSDLAGVNVTKYNSSRTDGNLISATSPSCTQIRKNIKELGISEHRAANRLNTASTRFEGLSNQMERLVHLLAKSRVIELEVIKRQFIDILPEDLYSHVIDDLEKLKSETNQ